MIYFINKIIKIDYINYKFNQYKVLKMTCINNTNKISYRAFTSYVNKSEDFEDVNKIPRELKRGDNNVVNYKKRAFRIKDSRLAYKNRRSINKDWKDFNNM